jgi:pimeloyl-ACP methyl ester carboxylesterase
MRRSVALAAVALAGGTVVARRRAAAGTAAAVAEAQRSRPAPLEGRVRTVTASDGVGLHVQEHGPQQAEATVVLAHGYTQSSRLWDGTVRDLLAAHPGVKVAVYDHRGHGRSGRTTQEAATLEQLARDLATVLDAVAPTGPVVLVGHSMGGMTLMALAEARPDLFQDRVRAVGFLATSSGGLDAVGWGLPTPLVPLFKALLPRVNEAAWKAELKGRPRRQIAWFEAFVTFASGADPADVRAVLDVQKECSAETVHFFLATFSDHDRREALAHLAHLPALVVVGERDRLCPVAHSRVIADALPQARLVVHPGAGHMVHLERRAEVGRQLARLVGQALAGPVAPVPTGRPAAEQAPRQPAGASGAAPATATGRAVPPAPPLERSWS